MSWLDIVDNTKELKDLYDGRVPRLDGGELNGLIFHEKKEVSIIFYLPDFPTAIPESWRAKKYNELQISIRFADAFNVSVRGWGVLTSVNFQITRLGDRVLAMLDSKDFGVRIEAARASIVKVSPILVRK